MVQAEGQWQSIKFDGTQSITTLDGYVIPLNIQSGLPYMTMRPYTDHEWEMLPHVILSADTDWNPSVLDYDFEDNEEWFDTIYDFPYDVYNSNFDYEGIIVIFT